jgi:small-conductance mechanosensitive channel
MQRILDFLRFDLWHDQAVLWGARLASALLLLLVGMWLAGMLGRVVARAIERRGGDAVLGGFLGSAVRIGLVLIVLVGALERTGVPTSSLLAALGAAGLAIGLALKDSLGNLAAGVLLVLQRPFRAGDAVEVGGQAGTVERIDLLRTVLVALDNRVVTVPNAQVMNLPIINFSARDERRLELPLSIALGGDATHALRVVREVLDAHARVIRTREPQLLLQRFGATGIELVARPWVRSAEVVDAQSEILLAIKAALDHAGIEIPPPPNLLRVVADTRVAAAPAATTTGSEAP